MTKASVANRSVDVTTVVVDEGSSQIKAVWVEDNAIHTAMIKSRAQHGIMETYDGTGISDDVYETEGTSITVGDRVMEPTSTTSDRYQTSNENRVLTHHILRTAGFGNQPIDLIVTLPVDTFFREASKKDIKKQHMMKPVTHTNGLPLAIINSVRVAPEAAPVLDSLCLNDHGEFIEEFDDVQRVMIVDIGGTTTDITVVTGDNSVEKRLSVKLGVFNIARNLKQAIQQDPAIKAIDPSMNAIDVALHSKTFRGKTDVSQHIQQACSPVIDRLLSEMNTVVEDPEDLDFICYVGGGAHLLQASLSSAYGGKTIVHPNPEFAVALGLIKNELSQSLTEQE